jgi:hypothetical protein
MLVASSASADDVRSSLRQGQIVIEADGKTPTIDVACDWAHAIVQKGNFVFVACGSQGVAVYDIHAPLEPSFHGRFFYDHPCLELNADGQCLATEAPVVPGHRDTTLRDAGITLVALGGATVVAGLAIEIGQLFANLPPICFFECTSHTGPPAAVGWAGLATIMVGAGVAMAGIPLWVSGTQKRVTAYATLGGGGLHVAF